MELYIRIAAVVICGVAGAALGWALASLLDWTGAGGAFVAAAVAMASATLLWAAGVALAEALRHGRSRP
jgi:hypothetical protein